MSTTDPTHRPGAGRREFLRLGGTGALAAVVLAACSDDQSPPPSETGVTEPVTETTLAPPQSTTPEAGEENDLTVTRTAHTVELAMIEVYTLFLDGTGGGLALPAPLSYTTDTAALLTLLQERHSAHADLVADVVGLVGGEPATEPNNGILAGIVEPQLGSLTTERAVVGLARTLEELAASTYGWGASTARTQVTEGAVSLVRHDLMAVGAVTARHAAALDLALDPSGSDVAHDALLDTSGPARLPDFMLVGPDADGGDALVAPEVVAEDAEGEGGEGDGEGDGG